MSESAQIAIGSPVTCSDGVCGELKRIVIDPVSLALTHLVVGPKHHGGLDRLVPVELVESSEKQTRLRCTQAEFEALEGAEETRSPTGEVEQWAYEPWETGGFPYAGLGIEGRDVGGGDIAGSAMGMPNAPQAISYDSVPLGEVEVTRDDEVHATDGMIGHVEGLAIDPSNHHVTHVLLEEGHLWGKKEVAIPISAVTGVKFGIHLNLTKKEIQNLPPVAPPA